MNGLLIISVPKSGTMFLSNYLGALTGYRSVFGLPGGEIKEMIAQLSGEPDPLVQAHMAPTSPDPAKMVKKYLQMINRNRKKPWGDHSGEDLIITDHGFDNFLLFLRNPDEARILPPSEVMNIATEMNMGVLYLYRKLGDIVNSFGHFLVSRKSHLMNMKTLDGAMEVSVKKYARVLAGHTELWKREFRDGLVMTYEKLNQDTKNAIKVICDAYSLPYKEEEIISDMKDYKAWTFRKGERKDFRKNLSQAHKDYLTTHFPDSI